ncbi:hypothetical protein BB560_004534, partial [Smittium megazygosporum]
MPPKNKQQLGNIPLQKQSRPSTLKSPKLDFNSFSMNLLRKYRQVYKLDIKARSSKEELVSAASEHHAHLMLDEIDTIARFIYI